MAEIKLREYQYRSYSLAKQAFAQYRRLMLQSPTGSGKTVLASYMITNAIAKGLKVYFVCHRKELIDQTSKTLTKFGIPHGFIANGYRSNFFHNVQICSVGTLVNRLEIIPDPDMVIFDEAHHAAAGTWAKIIDHFSAPRPVYSQGGIITGKKPGAYIIGFSATPERLDGRSLTPFFDHLVPGPQPQELIDLGHLSRYRLKSVDEQAVRELKMVNGKYILGESEHLMTKKKIVGDVVKTWQDTARGKLTMGFAPTVKASHTYVDAFKAAGISAVHLDGDTPSDERRSKLQALARGEIKIVYNVRLFAEGFDIAANSGMDVTIGCMIDTAPTESLSEWLQRCGRALRPQDIAFINDHAGNYNRHGLPSRDRLWTLAGREANQRANEGKDAEQAVREIKCSRCWNVDLLPVPENRCSQCGNPYPVRKIREYEEISHVDLIDVDTGSVSSAQAQAIADKEEVGNHSSESLLQESREVASLKTQLFNLSVGAKHLGIKPPFEKAAIMKMEKKLLRENIAYLKTLMKESPMVN